MQNEKVRRAPCCGLRNDTSTLDTGEGKESVSCAHAESCCSHQHTQVMQAMADNLTQFMSNLCRVLPSLPQSLGLTELIEASIDLFAKLWKQLRGLPCWMKALPKNVQLLLELNNNRILNGFPVRVSHVCTL